MLEIGLILLVTLHAADEAREPSLVAPMKLVLLEPQSLARLCPGARHRFDACTRFVQWNLSAQCAASDALWSMRVKARYEAMVFLAHGSATGGHEIQHVRDVEGDVIAHIRSMERRTFAGREPCEDAAAAAERAFPAALREFARRSQARRN